MKPFLIYKYVCAIHAHYTQNQKLSEKMIKKNIISHHTSFCSTDEVHGSALSLEASAGICSSWFIFRVEHWRFPSSFGSNLWRIPLEEACGVFSTDSKDLAIAIL